MCTPELHYNNHQIRMRMTGLTHPKACEEFLKNLGPYVPYRTQLVEIFKSSDAHPDILIIISYSPYNTKYIIPDVGHTRDHTVLSKRL